MEVRVTRAFLWEGARQEPGSVMDVPDAVARSLTQMGKAEPVGAYASVGVMTTENTSVLVPAKPSTKAKGARHAVD